jgi:hypothetical protein
MDLVSTSSKRRKPHTRPALTKDCHDFRPLTGSLPAPISPAQCPNGTRRVPSIRTRHGYPIGGVRPAVVRTPSALR